MGHGLGSETDDSDLSSAPPSPPPSRPSSPVPPHPPPIATRRKSAPSSSSTRPPKRTYQQRKHSTVPQAESSSPTKEVSSTEEDETKRKPRKRRAPVQKPKADTQTPKRRPRASTHTSSTQTPKNPAVTNLRPAELLETRPPSFLTKSFPVALQSSSLLLNTPRADVWSYTNLDGLVWVRLNVGEGKSGDGMLAGVEQEDGSLCWWPGQVTLRTPNVLKLTLCGATPNGTTALDLLPPSLSGSNALTFRRPATSSVRFPSFKHAYESSTPEVSSSEGDSKLESLWKVACARAFEIDTESNDGLEDICLLFSQKTRSTRDESSAGSVGNCDPDEDDGNRTDECDVIEKDTVVLCRYRTRYYPAKVGIYFPRGERGPRGKYLCKFADDSTRIAPRQEMYTQLDPGFATCLLGDYQNWGPDKLTQPWAGRAPTPEPRASSPAPEPSETIDTAEYCARERMRDQLRPLLPFLQGFISRTYTPSQIRAERKGGTGDMEECLDRHAAYMQGGRTRKNLAYSVHTGDLNEDDCEALMYEVSRWALRGERWGKAPRAASTDATSTNGTTVGANDATRPATGDVEMRDVNDNTTVTAGRDETEIIEAQPEHRRTPDTEPEDAGDKTIVLEDNPSFTQNNPFHELIKRQPARPTGAYDYEQLSSGERMGYISDVLYPEAAALVLSYRRGIRTQVGPLPDAQAEFKLYMAGLQEAKNTASKEDWVDKILATRQLREAVVNKNAVGEDTEQVVVAGGTRSRPKYMSSRTG